MPPTEMRTINPQCPFWSWSESEQLFYYLENQNLEHFYYHDSRVFFFYFSGFIKHLKKINKLFITLLARALLKVARSWFLCSRRSRASAIVKEWWSKHEKHNLIARHSLQLKWPQSDAWCTLEKLTPFIL